MLLQAIGDSNAERLFALVAETVKAKA